MLTVSQKAERVLKLLLGLRNVRVASSLASHGFGKKDLDEGWELLRGLARIKLDAIPVVANADPTLIADLDQWENKWFPIADASLARNFPEVREKFFLNLSQATGQAVVVTVSTFLERFAALDDKAFAPNAQAAKKLLIQRGLTPAVVGRAKQLLADLGTIEPVDAPLVGDDAAAQFEEAETAMWAWYLEWSQVVRVAIADRRLLRALGFLSTRSGVVEDSEEEPPVAAPPVTPSGPVASVGSGGVNGTATTEL